MSHTGHSSELDVLRGQVADLSRELAERDRVLREQSRHLGVTQALVHMGRWVWDLGSGDVWWSDEQFRLFGYEPGAIAVTRDTFLAALLPDDHDRVLAAVNDSLTGESPCDIECRIVRPSGEIRVIHCLGEISRDADGHPVKMDGTTVDVTERKAVEDSLRESQNLLRLFIEHAPAGLAMFDREMRYLHASRRWLSDYGLDEGAIRGRTHYELFPEIPERWKEAHRRGLSGETVREEIDRFDRADGSVQWLRWEIRPWHNSLGAVGGIVIFAEELTSHKKVEEALQENEARLRMALDAAGAGIWSWDVASNVSTWDAHYHELYGLGPDDPVSFETWIARVHPEDRARLGARIEALLVPNADDTWDEEFRATHPTKGERWMYGLGHVERDESGRAVRFTGINLDSTARKQTEEIVRTSEERLRQAVKATDLGLFDHDHRTDVIYWSPQMRALSGVDPGMVPTLSDYLALVHPDDRERILDAVCRAHDPSGDGLYCVEHRLIRPDGSVRWVSLRSQTYFEAADGVRCPVRTIGTMADVTERKRAETALQESEERLKAVIASLAEGIIFQDHEGRIVTCNASAEQILGLSQDQITGRTSMDPRWNAVHEDGSPFPGDTHPAVLTLRTCVPQSDVVMGVDRPDGSRRWISVNTQPVCLPDRPHCSGVVASFFDMTKRKLAEAALQEIEVLHQSVLSSVTAQIALLDSEGTILAVNEAWRNFADGNNASQTSTDAGINYLEVCRQAQGEYAEGAVEAARGIQDVLTGRLKEFSLEYPCPSPTEPRWFLMHVTPLKGALTGVVVSHMNITRLKQTEQALRASEARYLALIEAIPQQVWTARPDGALDYVNRRVSEYFDMSPDGLLGWEWQAVIHPDDLPLCLAAWSASLRTGEPYEVEFRLRRACDGAYCWHLARALPVRDDAGLIVKWFGTNTDITERKCMEEALRKSEERLRFLYDDNPSMYVTVALDGTILSVNRFGAQQLGYQPDELIGKPVSVLAHEDDAVVVHQQLAKAFADPSDRVVTLEFRKRTKEGAVIWVRELVRIARKDDAHPVALIVCEDISIRKQMETALAQREEHLQLFIEHSPVSLAMLDLDMRYVAVSRRWREEYRVGNGPLIGRSHYEVFPEISEHWKAIHRRCLAGAVEGCEEDPFVRGDGRTDWSRWEIRPWLKPDGSVGGIIIFSEDITLQVRARETQRRLAAIVESSDDAIISKDLDGHVTSWNRGAEQLFGYGAAEMLCESITRLIPPDRLNEEREILERMRRGDSIEHYETVRRTKQGALREVSLTISPMRDERGTIVGISKIARDITARKQAEETIRQRERDLRAAAKERERISEDLHDDILQSIFAVGLGLESCRMLVSKPPRKKAAAPLLAALNRAIGRLNHVMTDVRNFIAGIKSHGLEEADIGETLRAMAQAMCAANGTVCRVAIDHAAVRELLPEQVYHVVNIAREALSNSIRHSEAGRISLSLKRLRRSMRLSITDNGTGFVPDSVRDVGHGLANMAARARKLGSRIEIRSRPRHGTTVLLDIPRRSVDE
jgi:PAS domain S-box-containing protein